METIAGIEEEKKQYQDQRDIVLVQIRDDPENAELKALAGELNDLIALLDENIAELQPQQPKQPESPAVAEPSQPEKWSRDNHPAFKKAAAPEEKEEAPVNYQVNDTVLAKWVSGDRAFYPARITSITGSSTAPIYNVKFKSYDSTETLRSKDIRPVSNKRKADGTSAATAPATAASAASAPGLVSSAGATMYPEARNESQKGEDAPKPKPKKIKAKKELEASKSKWQEFNSKSKIAKTKKKESMFRTPEGINGRVGFTGSGQAMRKDPARVRPVYTQEKDE
ncbi:splicing factor Spf30 [Hirsutella rhossiliensis]|uniref:Splicing factor Spf30 n=1 Tax=Hirsutella rhossiliensis TaxID=111463 RepID=A0A9P8MUW0_9HYPO|nr:splicing factor Spf30 [Hirsutella rhossiliensis]KAH0961569.1 splicing factor Spf30 [Hirsutella rhossiliensis]